MQISFILQLQILSRAGLTFHNLRAAASGKKIANSFSSGRRIVAQARLILIRNAPCKNFCTLILSFSFVFNISAVNYRAFVVSKKKFQQRTFCAEWHAITLPHNVDRL